MTSFAITDSGQELSMDANIAEWKIAGNSTSLHRIKVSPTGHFYFRKGTEGAFTVKTWSKWSNLTSAIEEQSDTICPLMWCSEQDVWSVSARKVSPISNLVEQMQIEGYSTKQLTFVLQKYWCHEKQWTLEAILDPRRLQKPFRIT